MKLQHLAWITAALTATAIGCSKEPDPLAAEGESCSIDADCESTLACRNEVCVARAGTGNNVRDPDAGPEDDGGPDTPDPVVDEDYVVSYTVRNLNNEDTLWVYDTDADEHTRVTPDGETCNRGCYISDSLGHYIYSEANGPNFNVFVAPLDASFTPGAGTQIAENVRRVGVIGDHVTYVREEGLNVAYAYNLANGSEVKIGVIGDPAGTEGDWTFDPASGHAVVYSPTLQTLDVRIGSFGAEISDVTYTVDSSNFQETSGSYYGSTIPTAFSRDGNVMAMLTLSGPNDYGLCSSANDCTDGPGQRCGRFGRCSAIEVAVRFFDMNKLDNLGNPCSADAACGGIHTCDIPAETAVDQAVCMPRRVALGLPAQQLQQGETGCALTSGNDDYFYTEVRAPLTFGEDGQVYLTAARACGDLNMEHTAILRINPDNGAKTTVYSNEGEGFVADNCYNAAESAIDVTNCTIWVQRAALSPKANQLVFVGTNPNVTEPGLAQTNVDLWIVDRDGANHAWVGGRPQAERVRTFTVHPPR